jgi:hypothetical protein
VAFDQSLQIIPGKPSFTVLWSSTPTSSGHYLGAFLYGSIGTPTPGVTAQRLVQQVIPNIRFVFNVGFLVLGQQPPSSATPQAQAFASSVLQTVASYPQINTGQGLGGMILWLDALDRFDRASAFGLFTPTANITGSYPQQLDQTSHRLFDAGGDSRLLSVNPGAPAAQLVATAAMTIALQSPGGPIALSFGPSPYYAGVAASPATLTIELDTSQPNAGCLLFGGGAGSGLRNFELGFQHGFAPQGGLGGGNDAKPFRIFQPLLDRDEVLQGATVSAALNPLIPTTAAYNALQISRPGTPIVSGYRTRLGDKVSLAPMGAALFRATPCLGERSYFAPAGAFSIAAAGPVANRGLLGGLSAVEYLEFADGDVLTFVPGQNAGIASTTVTDTVDGQPQSYTTFAPAAAPDLTASQVSWAQLTPAGARDYICESDLAPMFAGPQPPSDPAAALDFKSFALRQLVPATASPAMPLLPYASLDFGNAGTDADMAAAFEHGFVAPTRLRGLEVLPPGGTTDGAIWAVTPQGYIARFDNGVMTSITLGTIDSKKSKDSSAALSFGSTTNPLTQELGNAFLANQQFIVVTCLTAALKDRYTASVNLSGWEFDVSLPDPSEIVPGAYRTVLLIKSAAGSVKRFAAEPYAWTAYATFNNPADDVNGQILSNWLAAYLAQAEAFYADGNGLTGLASFVELINDPDWNGYLYLHVPITTGDLDPSIQFLTAGIDPSQFFAHHVGCALNHTTVAGNAYQANSSYLGLVHYLRPGADPDNLVGAPPYVPQSVDYDFQLLTLEARFENSVLVNFRSSAQLLMSRLFGDAVLPSSPDPRVTATDALMIFGTMQTADDVPHYVFATAKDASSTFFLSGAAFERVEIDRAVVAVGTTVDVNGFRTATFQMSGWFGLLPAAKFDVLSYAAVSFDKLALDMLFQTGQPSSYVLRTEGVTLTQMPGRLAQDDELITSASAAANTIYRPKSLAAGFPLEVTRLMTVTDTSQTPASLGYRDLATQVSLGSPSLSGAWYGLEFDLPLGGGGALSSGSLFTAKMLFAWAPNGGGQIAIKPFFMLQGPGGANLTLEIEGVLKLGAAGILLMQNKRGQFVLELASLGITVLSKSFPPAGTTNLLLAGVGTDTQRYLGWFGAYVEATPGKK